MRGVATQAEAVVERALAEHHPRISLACSFQKEESVLVHMLLQQVPDPRAFTIDTGVLFPETYATWRRFEERFGLNVDVYDATGPGAPWTAENCCGARKVDALNEALGGLDAWITGLRREQAPTRAAATGSAFDEGAACGSSTR